MPRLFLNGKFEGIVPMKRIEEIKDWSRYIVKHNLETNTVIAYYEPEVKQSIWTV